MGSLGNFQRFKVGVVTTYSRGKGNFVKNEKNVEMYMQFRRKSYKSNIMFTLTPRFIPFHSLIRISMNSMVS